MAENKPDLLSFSIFFFLIYFKQNGSFCKDSFKLQHVLNRKTNKHHIEVQQCPSQKSNEKPVKKAYASWFVNRLIYQAN
jgi:hypothetical protein